MLVVESHVDDILVLQDEEFIPLLFHELKEFESLILGNDDELVELVESLLFGLQNPVNDGDGLGSKSGAAVVGDLDHQVNDVGLNYRLNFLLGRYFLQELVDHLIIALNLEHRVIRKGTHQAKLFRCNFEVFELISEDLNENIRVYVSNKLDDLETLHLALNHEDVAF